MYSVAKRDKGLCRERHTTDKQSEDCITYLTAVVAHECKASQQGFDVREKENSNLRCSVAKRDKGFCSERDTADRQSKDCVKYRTADVARECKAPQQAFDLNLRF